MSDGVTAVEPAKGLSAKMLLSGWNAATLFFVVSVVCAALICVATFLDVVCVPPVGAYLTANIFEIDAYVTSLNDQFGRWLPQMMMEPTGSNMSFLLGVAAPALKVLVVLALASLVGLIVYVVLFWRRKRTTARIVGVVSFVASALYPLVLLVGQLIVGYEFSSGSFPPVAILTLEPPAYLWLFSSLIGIVSIVFACGKTKSTKGEGDEC